MKKYTTLLLLCFSLLLLSGCSFSKGNTLLKNASPKTSALALYTYDGTATERAFLFDESLEKEILNSIASVNTRQASDWTPEQITFPVYGLEIGGTDGFSIQAVWSNGYWISSDGTVSYFDYDFASLAKNYDWSDKDSWSTISVLPCSRLLCQYENNWVPTMLSPAKELTPPEHISVSLVSQTEDALTVKFTNNGTEEWSFGEYFSLHVLLDGIWYEVPALPGDWAFNDIAYLLPAQESQEKPYDLSFYGDLPKGTYRFTAEDAAVEFTVE